MTYHSHQEIIQNYVESNFGKVYLADGEALDVVGMGDIRIILPNGSVWLLQKVQYIPDPRRNLISVRQFNDKGMQYYLLVVPGRLQREPWYWLVERKLVLCI